MNFRAIFAGTALAAIACATATAAPLEAYGRLPTLENVVISPDGNTLAFEKTVNGERLVIVTSAVQDKMIGALRIGDAKLRELSWADDKHLILTTSSTAVGVGLIGPRQEWRQAQVFNTDTHKQIALMEHTDSDFRTMNVIAGDVQFRSLDGHSVAFVEGIYFPSDEGKMALFEIDLDTGRARLVESGSDYTDWVVDEQGVVVARSNYNDRSQHWMLELKTESGWTTALDVPAAIDTPHTVGLTSDNAAIVVSLPKGDERDVEAFSLKDGRQVPVPEQELGGGEPILDASSNRIIGRIRTTDKTNYVFSIPRAAAVWRAIAAAYSSATNIEVESWTPDWNKVVVQVSGAMYGDRYDLVNMTTHRSDVIGSAYDGIGPDDFAPVKWITYKAGDGRSISGYLTLPKDRPAKNLALIVLPHGGPHSRDFPGFDWLSQALASRGYAVLQPEFRGSNGFGRDLLSAGFGQFGRKMQTDLSDGVRTLVDQGVVDAAHVCIVGASYGGYAALAGAAFEPTVYRCAASYAGMSDLGTFMRHMAHETRVSDNLSTRYWDRFLGVSDWDDPALDAISPIKHTANITAPILLIHGTDDTVVQFSQSEDMADALKAAGKSVEFVRLDGEDHWLSRSETRLQMLSAIVKFLDANNPPAPKMEAETQH